MDRAGGETAAAEWGVSRTEAGTPSLCGCSWSRYSVVLTPSTPQQKRRSVFLIILFTFLAATAQVLWKYAIIGLGEHPTPLAIATNIQLIAGLAVYGIGAVIMIIALQHGELSVLYPLISLNYVWVAIVAVLLFNESMNPAKIAGIVVIMAGVGILGKGAHE
jgi:drug/metabolite transporter (DMT)-like permease